MPRVPSFRATKAKGPRANVVGCATQRPRHRPTALAWSAPPCRRCRQGPQSTSRHRQARLRPAWPTGRGCRRRSRALRRARGRSGRACCRDVAAGCGVDGLPRLRPHPSSRRSQRGRTIHPRPPPSPRLLSLAGRCAEEPAKDSVATWPVSAAPGVGPRRASAIGQAGGGEHGDRIGRGARSARRHLPAADKRHGKRTGRGDGRHGMLGLIWFAKHIARRRADRQAFIFPRGIFPEHLQQAVEAFASGPRRPPASKGPVKLQNPAPGLGQDRAATRRARRAVLSTRGSRNIALRVPTSSHARL